VFFFFFGIIQISRTRIAINQVEAAEAGTGDYRKGLSVSAISLLIDFEFFGSDQFIMVPLLFL